MRVKKERDQIVYDFKGSLEKEIVKAEKEISTIDEKMPMYEMIYEKAKKEYKSKLERLEHLKRFVELGKEEISKRELENTK